VAAYLPTTLPRIGIEAIGMVVVWPWNVQSLMMSSSLHAALNDGSAQAVQQSELSPNEYRIDCYRWRFSYLMVSAGQSVNNSSNVGPQSIVAAPHHSKARRAGRSVPAGSIRSFDSSVRSATRSCLDGLTGDRKAWKLGTVHNPPHIYDIKIQEINGNGWPDAASL